MEFLKQIAIGFTIWSAVTCHRFCVSNSGFGLTQKLRQVAALQKEASTLQQPCAALEFLGIRSPRDEVS